MKTFKKNRAQLAETAMANEFGLDLLTSLGEALEHAEGKETSAREHVVGEESGKQS